jgi:Kef-type K+ transport system membrane component KefB
MTHTSALAARILAESKLLQSAAGVMTMGAAALNDAIAWCLMVVRRHTTCS